MHLSFPSLPLPLLPLLHPLCIQSRVHQRPSPPRASTTQARGAEYRAAGVQARPCLLPALFHGRRSSRRGGGVVVRRGFDALPGPACTCLSRHRTHRHITLFSPFFWRGDTRRIHTSVKDCTRANQVPNPIESANLRGSCPGEALAFRERGWGGLVKGPHKAKRSLPPPSLPRFLFPRPALVPFGSGPAGISLGAYVVRRGTGGRGGVRFTGGLV